MLSSRAKTSTDWYNTYMQFDQPDYDNNISAFKNKAENPLITPIAIMQLNISTDSRLRGK